jgi:hypothetical protein
MASLLSALATGNLSGAQSDITKIKADLKAQQSSSSSDSRSSVKISHGHHHHSSAAAPTDSTSTGSTSATTSTTQSTSPFDSLLSQISSSLSQGSTAGALQDLATFLVQNGQGTGNLVNASV